METNTEPIKEVLGDLFTLLEALETQNIAVLQFLKDQGFATDEKFTPYLERAGAASSVKWRAARARMTFLLVPAPKKSSAPEKENKDKEAEPKEAETKKVEAAGPQPKESDPKSAPPNDAAPTEPGEGQELKSETHRTDRDTAPVKVAAASAKGETLGSDSAEAKKKNQPPQPA